MDTTTAPAETKADTTAATSPVGAADVAANAAELKQTESASLIGADDAKAEAPKLEAGKGADAPKPIDLKLPEGFVADEAQLTDFKKEAAELGLDSAKAQKVFDRFVSIETARNKAVEESFAKQDSGWLAELKADSELGGKNFEKTAKHVKAGEAILGADVAKVIRAAGLGNNPALVRAFAKLGRLNANDSIGSAPQAANGQPPPVEHALYPTMFTNSSKES